jgi:hypothetical protein
VPCNLKGNLKNLEASIKYKERQETLIHEKWIEETKVV